MLQVTRQDGMKTAWTKNRNADSVRSFAYRKGKFMKSKVEFYKAFFEELEKKGFGVAQPSSPDYRTRDQDCQLLSNIGIVGNVLQE